MIVIKEILEDGDYIITPINCNLKEAKKYFEGAYINKGVVNDNIIKCIRVEEIK